MLLNECKATALHYGFNRRNELEEQKRKYVAFVDIGHSKTTVSIAGFTKLNAKILWHKSDRNLGGRDLDFQIMQQLGEEFLNQFGDDPRQSAKCRSRMLQSIEKARKILSGDTEANIHIDYLMNDEDLSRKLTRDQFNELIQPQV